MSTPGCFAAGVDVPDGSVSIINSDGAADGAAFLADLCHQVRTPLNGILGTLELLLENDLSDEAYELARVAYDSAVALHRVFEADLLHAVGDT